jgi:hypothetical protein
VEERPSEAFVLFMSLAFVLGREPRAGDPDPISPALHEANKQQAVQVGVSDNEFSGLLDRVFFIEEEKIRASGSSKTVLASSKLTLCFLRSVFALSKSHSNEAAIAFTSRQVNPRGEPACGSGDRSGMGPIWPS